VRAGEALGDLFQAFAAEPLQAFAELLQPFAELLQAIAELLQAFAEAR
jgi:CBS domain containing-hemolysin-like protein